MYDNDIRDARRFPKGVPGIGDGLISTARGRIALLLGPPQVRNRGVTDPGGVMGDDAAALCDINVREEGETGMSIARWGGGGGVRGIGTASACRGLGETGSESRVLCENHESKFKLSSSSVSNNGAGSSKPNNS